MARVLITGATGFVGANLARRLIYDGHDVHLIVRPGYTAWRIEGLRADARIHAVSLENREGLLTAARSIRPEWVFHLAAYGAYSWETDLERMARTNLIGTANLIDACLPGAFEVMVNTGSSSEYGFKDHAPREDERLEPNSLYAITKASATHLCVWTARAHHVRIPTLRLYSAYGPYEEPNRLIPTLIVFGLEGRLPPLVSAGVARDYVFVSDVVEAYLLAARRADAPHDAVYNIGSGVETPISEVVETVQRLLSIPQEPQWSSMPDRAWDTGAWVANPAAAARALGWRAATQFEDGLKLTLDWLRDDVSLLEHYQQAIFGSASSTAHLYRKRRG